MTRRSFALVALVALVPLVAACYRYARVDAASELPPGMGVRARVNGATADQIEPILGTSNVRLLTGKLIATTADTLIVEVPAVYNAAVGSSMQTLNQRIAIPRSGVVELESRQLDRQKTYVVAGAAAVIIGGYILRSTVFDPGGGGIGGPGRGPELRIPIFSLRR